MFKSLRGGTLTSLNRPPGVFSAFFEGRKRINEWKCLRIKGSLERALRKNGSLEIMAKRALRYQKYDR